MELVVISSPKSENDEIETMVQLLDHGLYRLHLRKPDWSKDQVEALIAQIPVAYYPKISLHEHHELIEALGLGGRHFKSDQTVHAGSGVGSKSFHDLAAMEDDINHSLDYGFIGPVFDSISKPGYRQQFTVEKIGDWIANHKRQLSFRLFALGGIIPKHLPDLKLAGFDGAALLGGVWNGTDTQERLNRFLTYKNIPL
ncbi:thiamine phosphate synthase [Echinicola vietnamensis]|uniref:Thiamine monophosphate synthase n=1 Tax=Echinicola vietnamensis (strain DSM 17526 / LMG 23754 / KMM 6221) TaxID=926556 RepID=L0G2L2_ECHVK|nr:thiamine phosphate synthase [Echinicola vietnamensis]AGA79782.1 thiamine monophosphate synthase [Echinicola vietnamensis DSM 17526]